MSTVAKAFVVLNLILGLIFVSISGVLFAHREHWKAQALDAQRLVKDWTAQYNALKEATSEQIQALISDKSNLKSALDDKTDEVDQKKTQITRLNTQIKQLSEANQSLQQSFDDLTKRWQVTDQERKTTIAELERRTAELRRVREAKSLADEEIVRLTAALGESSRRIARLDEQIQNQQDDIGKKDALLQAMRTISPETYWAVAKKTDLPIKAPLIRGKIMGVEPDHGIVVLSVGREDQVEPNMKFIVFRGAQYIGEVIVDKVLAQQCSALINKPLTPGQIMVGDEVTTQLGS